MTFQIVKMAIITGITLNRNIMRAIYVGKETSNEIEKMIHYGY